MAAEPTPLNFGSFWGGQTPVFTQFSDTSGVPLTPPAITEVGGGWYIFYYDPAVTVLYTVSIPGGPELGGELTPTVAQIAPSAPPLGGLNAVGRFPTAGDIVIRVGEEVGLGTLQDPYASTEAAVVQLRGLLRSAADEVLASHPVWPQLLREGNFTTVSGQTRYSTPADFRGMINLTGWNRTTRIPLRGPVLSGEWNRLLAWNVKPSLHVAFRVTPMEFIIYPDPPDGLEIAYEYASSYWVQSAASLSPDRDRPANSSDTVLFDEALISRALKLKFLQSKGFDTTAAVGDYITALQSAAGRAGGAKKLTLDGRRPDARTVAQNGGIVYL